MNNNELEDAIKRLQADLIEIRETNARTKRILEGLSDDLLRYL